MAPARPSSARAGRPGTFSARQWADIRQASRLAVSTGASIEMHGVKLAPGVSASRTTRPAQQDPPQRRQPRAADAAPDAARAQPMDTDGGARHEQQSKKQLRDARRLQDFQEQRKKAERWLPLVTPYLRIVRWNHAQSVWTAWMRRSLSPRRDARRRLRALLWRAWTQQRLGHLDTGEDPTTHARLGGLLSHRDCFILQRTHDFCAAAWPHVQSGLYKVGDMPSLRAGDGEFRDEDMATAIAMSLADQPAKPGEPGNSHDHAEDTLGGSPGPAGTRRVDEAGLLSRCRTGDDSAGVCPVGPAGCG